jgi:hypothetical protein
MSNDFKERYLLISRLKRMDAYLQALCFVCMTATAILVDKGASVVGLLLMAGIQVFSAFFWLVTLYKIPGSLQGATCIRIVFMVLPFLLFLIFRNSNGQVILYTAYAMIGVGPVCGFLYFIATVTEVSHYKKLARI